MSADGADAAVADTAGTGPAPGAAVDGWRELEGAVERLLGAHDEWRRRALEAEQRVRALRASLEGVSSGAIDPERMERELEALRARNRELNERLAEGRERAERVLARLRFVEEER